MDTDCSNTVSYITLLFLSLHMIYNKVSSQMRPMSNWR